MNKNIAQYDTEDFVIEDSFRSWVLEPNSPHQFFWDKYQAQHPQQQSEILDAKHLVILLNSLQQETPDQKMADDMWQRIQAEIQAEPQPQNRPYSYCLA